MTTSKYHGWPTILAVETGMSQFEERESRLRDARDALVRAARRLDVVRRRAKQVKDRGGPMEPMRGDIERSLADVDRALSVIDGLIADAR